MIVLAQALGLGVVAGLDEREDALADLVGGVAVDRGGVRHGR